MLQLFAADEVRRAQRDTAVQVSLRLGEGGLFDVNIRLQLLAVDHLLTGLTHAGGQLRLGFLKRLLGIGLIEGDQRIAFLHVVRVVSPDFGHAARDLGHDLYLVPCHVGIVGLFVVTQYQKPVNPICHGNNNEEQCQQQKGAFTLSFFAAWLLRGLALRICTHVILHDLIISHRLSRPVYQKGQQRSAGLAVFLAT